MQRVTIVLEIRGTSDDAQTVVERLLDDGVLQDAINEHEYDAGALKVTSAMLTEVRTADHRPPPRSRKRLVGGDQ